MAIKKFYHLSIIALNQALVNCSKIRYSNDQMKPYEIYFSPRSPFARRVRIACARLDFPTNELEIDVFNPTSKFYDLNPLGMIPVLVVPNGEKISDSWAILETLHEESLAEGGPGIWPTISAQKIRVRNSSVLAEGLMQFAVNRVVENRKTAICQDYLKEQEENIDRVLSKIHSEYTPKYLWVDDGFLTQAGWDLGVALEYLDFRYPELKWREKFPRLVTTLELCQRADFFNKTRPVF